MKTINNCFHFRGRLRVVFFAGGPALLRTEAVRENFGSRESLSLANRSSLYMLFLLIQFDWFKGKRLYMAINRVATIISPSFTVSLHPIALSSIDSKDGLRLSNFLQWGLAKYNCYRGVLRYRIYHLVKQNRSQ